MGSRLGHCTGLLFIDVAAHATSVDAWRKPEGQQWVEGGVHGEGKRRYNMSRRGCKTFPVQAPDTAELQTML